MAAKVENGRVERSELKIDAKLAGFVENEVLAPLGKDPAKFWMGFSALLERLVPVNRRLLAKRDALQVQIDAWHVARASKVLDASEYRAFLTQIGYLVPEPAPFTVTTQNVDAEIATMAGPQLVVPMLNARFLLNAANARWGSLYDAYYGTDALDAAPARAGGYDADRGAAVVAAAKAFLDSAVPLAKGTWAELSNPEELGIELRDPSHYASGVCSSAMACISKFSSTAAIRLARMIRQASQMSFLNRL
jgi:malate synthase